MKFFPLDQSDEESVGDVLLQIDLAIQYGEDMEPEDPVSCLFNTLVVSHHNLFGKKS